MSDEESLPPHLVYLVKQIARDCARPGIYAITLSVPEHKSSSYSLKIARYERIRQVSISRKKAAASQDGKGVGGGDLG